ncbi:MAG: polyhydroxybutyrate depolymerase [Gemmatimonadetes bacterium]|uniref:Polyhydroxybutyrate depolymerase n=1 Tax=Candidatus Kutchimonas denitrificans TaxID=3056748 RepID=A0AAE4ZD48_9BACT|nr:polyhydroxybutyrate depolymerase [Gemmatimonadota bacterium]NIR76661.1 polyhydroxybutyrate depolymerase [Candidatus Kutchimonas denitrificans]NIS02410.1 polyhydroxybutyrate depolymerase [Gemmatimonadota bacterium]NIT68314.1 polyhydroxybutyrate depolymerase [Gemmatimonadota bacterium]NIU54781.1 polyhydroxybutyrate depolymerase [Gemmatimonadota bacterium]
MTGMRTCVLLLGAAALACSAHGGPDRLAPGDHTITLAHAGRPRAYIVHVPPDTSRPLPVVLSFHGGGGSAEGHARHVAFDRLADEEGFIVVTPYGTGPFRWRLLTWNAEDCCGYAREHDVDDVGFIRALLDDLAGRVRLDAARIYATGLSNGGMFSYRLAAEAADRIAAVAPVGGAVRIDSIRARRPVPILHIHSVDDPRALYEGGLAPPFPFTGERFDHVAVEAVLEDWVRHNGCPSEPTLVAEREGRSGTAGEGHSAETWLYAPCAAGTEIVLWKLRGPGHVWPGAPRLLPEALVGEPTEIIDANGIVWEFFERHALPD